MGRWDYLVDKKPQELKDFVLEQVAGQLTEGLRNFPPAIEEWLDESLHARYRDVLSRVTRPELETFRVACELERAQERYDEFRATVENLVVACSRRIEAK